MSSVAKGKSELRFANELNYDVCIREKGEKPPSEQFVALGVGEKKQDILLYLDADYENLVKGDEQKFAKRFKEFEPGIKHISDELVKLMGPPGRAAENLTANLNKFKDKEFLEQFGRIKTVVTGCFNGGTSMYDEYITACRENVHTVIIAKYKNEQRLHDGLKKLDLHDIVDSRTIIKLKEGIGDIIVESKEDIGDIMTRDRNKHGILNMHKALQVQGQRDVPHHTSQVMEVLSF